MTDWTDWTPSPFTDERLSEAGDQHIDVRALLNREYSDSPQVDNPFAFTATQLGQQLYDPKSLDILRAIGGLESVTLGLRTDLNKGLSPDEDKVDGHVTLEDVWRTLETPQIRRSQTALIVLKRPDNAGVGTEASVHEFDPPTTVPGFQPHATPPHRPRRFEDRRRVFGENRIPVRPLKNIFQLMWIALHDKILVWSPTLR